LKIFFVQDHKSIKTVYPNLVLSVETIHLNLVKQNSLNLFRQIAEFKFPEFVGRSPPEHDNCRYERCHRECHPNIPKMLPKG
jgi:hypothetical protein